MEKADALRQTKAEVIWDDVDPDRDRKKSKQTTLIIGAAAATGLALLYIMSKQKDETPGPPPDYGIRQEEGTFFPMISQPTRPPGGGHGPGLGIK